MASAGGKFWLGLLVGLAVAVAVALLVGAIMWRGTGACPMCGGMLDDHDRMMDGGMGMMDGQDMPRWMMSRDMMDQDMGDMMEDMRLIHTLLANHEQIQREVEDIPGGVRTVTTSTDPAIAQAIRKHVQHMHERIEDGTPIRMMDPLFREIFEHHEAIDMRIEDIDGGVRVTETSEDPQVVLLIRQHARQAVSEFVDRGMKRAMQPTPLPEGYAEPSR